MKYKISLLIIMILIIRVPVFVVYDGDQTILVKVPISPIPIEIRQVHSVSLTQITDYYNITAYYIHQYEVVYSDQGGAGMPNHDQTILNEVFYSQYSHDSKCISLLMDDYNEILVSNKEIEYHDSKAHYMQMKIDRLFLFEYIYKVGKL